MVENKEYKFKVQKLDEAGQFEGYGAVSGNEDSYADIIEQGAFKKTLRDNKVFPLLWQHRTDAPIGLIDVTGEDEMGLPVVGDINLETVLGREAYSLLKQFTDKGRPMGLSIGYQTMKDKVVDGIRYLKEIRLHEISLVTFPANPLALVSGVKSVTSFRDLPIVTGNMALPFGAEARVRVWAGAEDGPNEKYREAFVWSDTENPDDWDSYKFQIADVADGELKVIPSAVFAAAGALQGATGRAGIPEVDRQRAKNHIGRYYTKLNRMPPWEETDAKRETVIAFLSALKADGFDITEMDALISEAVPSRDTPTDLEAAVEMVKSYRTEGR